MIYDMFKTFVDFIAVYWVDILTVLGLLVVGYVGVYAAQASGNWTKVRQVLLTLVIEAEKYLGTGTGEQKKIMVIRWFRERYKFLAFFLSEAALSDLIEDVLLQLKESLAKNNADLDTLENNLMRQAQDTPKLE